MARLSGGNLLLLRHLTGWSPHDPEQPRNKKYRPRRNFCLEVYGSLGRLQGVFDEKLDEDDVIQLGSVSIHGRRSNDETWYAFNDFCDRERNLYDHRRKDDGRTSRSMTDDDVARWRFATPPFGDFEAFWQRVRDYLETEGFGTFR
jgi:hypothetical protein